MYHTNNSNPSNYHQKSTIKKLPDFPLILLSTVYLLSGFCALLYQTIWIYRFNLVFGSTIFAVSVVISIFFGGIALGSHYFGKISTNITNPVRLYGLIEICIGIYSLFFQYIIDWFEKIYSGIYPHLSGNLLHVTFIRVIIAFLVLIIPTVLMGGTLPILLKHFARQMVNLGSRAGLIYGLNALGAALGSLLSGFILLRILGMTNTNFIAASINIAIGLLALIFSKQIKAPVSIHSQNDQYAAGKTCTNSTLTVNKIIVACFAISGFVSMSYEMVWLRYLVLFFNDTIYLYTGIITAFIFGIGIGSLVCGYMEHRIKQPIALLGIFQAGIGATTLIAIYSPLFLNDFFMNAGEKNHWYMLGLIFLILIPPTLLMGATFPLVTKIITPNILKVGYSAGRAYALNTLGSIAGTLLTPFIFFPLLGLQGTLYILFGTNMILAVILIKTDHEAAHPKLVLIPYTFLISFTLFFTLKSDYFLPDAVFHKNIKPTVKIIDIKEGAISTTWATISQNSTVWLLDNKTVIGKNLYSHLIPQGIIPLLIKPEIPKSVLGLAFGAGLSSYGSRLFPEVKHFDFVDISKENINVALKHFPENKGLQRNPRARFIIDDAYNFVKFSNSTYDLILIEATPPMYCYRSAILYSNGFYEFVKKRLSNNGYFSQVLPLGNLSKNETISIMKTFSSVFRYCLLWFNGHDCVMLGSNQEFALDLIKTYNRLKAPKIQSTLEKYSKYHYNVIGNFLSGLLLTTNDFRNIAENGQIYTEDRSGLMFSSGQNITDKNIELIHDNLTSFEQIGKNHIQFSDFSSYRSALTLKREEFIGELYSQ